MSVLLGAFHQERDALAPFTSLLASIPDTEKTPLGEMGGEYWMWIAVLVIGVLAVLALTVFLFKKKHRILGVLVFLLGGAGCVAPYLKANGLREIQEFEDPGIPDIELPDLDDLEMEEEMLEEDSENEEG